MKNKLMLPVILLMFFAFATGCSNVKNDGKTAVPVAGTTAEAAAAGSTADESVNVTASDESAAGTTAEEAAAGSTADELLTGLTAGAVEINIAFESEGMYGSLEPIRLVDKKILSEITSMIENSQRITNELSINEMSGMATKQNKLLITAEDGGKKEITFAFDDPAFAVGYLEVDGKKYDPGYSFFRYIRDFTQYDKYDTDIDDSVIEMLKKYGWTADYKAGTFEVSLPRSFLHEAGEFPAVLYWAYNNELSKSIGLDFSGYAGKEVVAEMYRLREPLPEFLHPMMDARGITLKYEGEIIGAFIDAGRHRCFACSLDGKSLSDVTGKDWDTWVSDHVNYENLLEARLSKMSPEEIIREYYKAMNDKDETTMFACMTRQNSCDYLSMNMDNKLLMNSDFDSAYAGLGGNNVKSVKIISLKEIEISGSQDNTVEYEVILDYRFRKLITSESGEQPRFIIMKKESERSGWRIQGEETG
ncbi:MAG: DUF4829 domain-containing protein [Clostridiales bacterium]|nr:DUF4829 domain-containing protein [Clostridiales bacterium]